MHVRKVGQSGREDGAPLLSAQAKAEAAWSLAPLGVSSWRLELGCHCTSGFRATWPFVIPTDSNCGHIWSRRHEQCHHSRLLVPQRASPAWLQVVAFETGGESQHLYPGVQGAQTRRLAWHCGRRRSKKGAGGSPAVPVPPLVSRNGDSGMSELHWHPLIQGPHPVAVLAVGPSGSPHPTKVVICGSPACLAVQYRRKHEARHCSGSPPALKGVPENSAELVGRYVRGHGGGGVAMGLDFVCKLTSFGNLHAK